MDRERLEFKKLASRKSAAQKADPAAGRLDVRSWTLAALDALAEHGIEGVRVEKLARDLGVTKGSFYWHFKDREELFDSMLNHWRLRSTIALVERVNQSDSHPRERLKNLVHLVFGPGSTRGDRIELSIRLWSHNFDRAAAALHEVDNLRIRYIAQLIADGGVSEEEAKARAIIVYAYMRVAPSLRAVADEHTIALSEMLLFERNAATPAGDAGDR